MRKRFSFLFFDGNNILLWHNASFPLFPSIHNIFFRVELYDFHTLKSEPLFYFLKEEEWKNIFFFGLLRSFGCAGAISSRTFKPSPPISSCWTTTTTTGKKERKKWIFRLCYCNDNRRAPNMRHSTTTTFSYIFSLME